MQALTESEIHDSASSPKVGVLLIGAVALVRMGLRQLLSGTDGVVVVGEAELGPQAVAEASRIEPDVAVIDADHIDEHFMLLLSRLHRGTRGTRSIILSDEEFGGKIIHTIDQGVLGYLPRDVSARELSRAIRMVGRGQAAITGCLAPEVLTGLRMIRATAIGLPLSLSRKETMVIRAMADGDTNPQIARTLGLSVPTVKSHVRSILKKTSARNRAAAIAAAFRRGMLL